MGKSVSVTEKIVEENEESKVIKSILLGSEHLKPLIFKPGACQLQASALLIF